MPEFIGRPNLPTGLAEQGANLKLQGYQAIAGGINQAGEGIADSKEKAKKRANDIKIMQMKAQMQAQHYKMVSDAYAARVAGAGQRNDTNRYADMLKSGQLQPVQPPKAGFLPSPQQGPTMTPGNLNLPQTSQVFPGASGPNMAIGAPVAKPGSVPAQANAQTKQDKAVKDATDKETKATDARQKAEIAQAMKAHDTVSKQLADLNKQFKTQGTENAEYINQAAPLMSNLRDTESKLSDLKVPGFDASAPPGYTEDMAAALHNLGAKTPGFTVDKVNKYMADKYPEHAPYVKSILGIKDPSTWDWIKGKASAMLSGSGADANAATTAAPAEAAPPAPDQAP